MSSLEIILLGSLSVRINNQPVDSFSTAKARALLAYIAVEGHRPLERIHLANLLWPDGLEESARVSLRQALSNLRKTLGEKKDATPPLFLIDRRFVQLHPESIAAGHIRVDVVDFQLFRQRAKNAIDAAQQAVKLYRGPFLADAKEIDSPAYDKWLQIQREALHRQMAGLLTTLQQHKLESGDLGQATLYAQKLVEHEPWSENAHMLLMETLWKNGQPKAALHQYELCCQLLDEELNVNPSPEMTALCDAIRNNPSEGLRGPPSRQALSVLDGAIAPDRPAIKATKRSSPHNLPAQLKSFFGREDELFQMSKRFKEPNCRQLTLVGPGGIGKTQLSLEYARRVLDDFEDGVWFVSLAGVADSEQIPPVIINSLGIVMTPEQDPLTRLQQYLRERSLLLILDNYEHLLDNALLVSELLSYAPNLNLLVTSRERLNLQVETVYPVGGLDLPSLNDPIDVQFSHLSGSGAVSLFVDCAQRSDLTFELTADSGRAVAQICHLVDGMPLAIELAAVWIRTLSCQDILENLRRSVDMLTVSMPDIPERHRCMRVLLDEAWQQLSQEAQQIFMQASVFRGGCEWPALEKITNASVWNTTELVERSMLHREQDGRYQIHELMRQYGEEKLSEFGQQKEVSERHARYYLRQLQQMQKELIGREQVAVIQQVSSDLDNFRAAWNWALWREDFELLDLSAEALFQYHDTCGLAHEGTALFERAAEQITECLNSSTPILVRIRNYLGAFLEPLGRGDECKAMLTVNLDAARELELPNAAGWALLRLGSLNIWSDIDVALDMLNECLELFRQTDDSQGTIATLTQICFSTRKLDRQVASDMIEDALQLARELEAPILIANCLSLQAHNCNVNNQPNQARAYQEEALAIAKLMNNQLLEASLLNGLAVSAAYLDEAQQSRSLLEESLGIYQQIGLESGNALTVQDNLGVLATRMGEWETALYHFEQTANKSRRAKNSFMLARCQRGMAVAWINLGEYGRARQELRAALQMKDLWAAEGARMRIKENMVQLLMGEGAYEAAAYILAHNLHHDVDTPLSPFDGIVYRDQLTDILGIERYQSIEKNAIEMDIKKYIDDILAVDTSSLAPRTQA